MLDPGFGNERVQCKRFRRFLAVAVFGTLFLAAAGAIPAKAMPIPLCPNSRDVACPVPPGILRHIAKSPFHSQIAEAPAAVEDSVARVEQKPAASLPSQHGVVLFLKLLMDPGSAGEILFSQYGRTPQLPGLY